MNSLLILLMAFLLFLVLVGILIYISLKRRYNEKHLVEDYTMIDNSFDDQEVDIIRIEINNMVIPFEANGYVLNKGDTVNVYYKGAYVDGKVVSGNSLETFDRTNRELLKLKIKSSIDNRMEDDIIGIDSTKKYADEEDFVFPDFNDLNNSPKDKE